MMPSPVWKSQRFHTCSPTTASNMSNTSCCMARYSHWYSSLHCTLGSLCTPASVSAPYSVNRNGLLDSVELIPALHIPAVIPVQADDIRELMALVFACGGHHQIGVGQRTMLRIERARVIEYLLEIRHGRLGCRVVGGVDEIPSAGGPRHSFRRRGQFRTQLPTQSSGRPARTACLRARSRPHTRACCSCDR